MMETFTEHRASSYNDTGLWKKLLEKAKRGTTMEPYFVADIGVENLQTSMFAKLGLPATFLEHHRNKLTENVILEGPDGHKWPVMLGMSWDSNPCLLQGWLQFAADCNLAVNDHILFYLWEDSHFLVQVFDSNRNIKRRGGGTSPHMIARDALPQVTDPEIPSFGIPTTTRPNIFSRPPNRNNDDSGDTQNVNNPPRRPVHKENHSTGQASQSGEKLGNHELGVEDDNDDRVIADFITNPGENVKSFRRAPLSDAQVDQAMSMARSQTTGRKGGKRDPSRYDSPPGLLTSYDYIIKDNASHETAEARDIEEKIPEKRTRKAPTDRSKAASSRPYHKSARIQPPRGMKKTPPGDPSRPNDIPARIQPPRGMKTTPTEDPSSPATKSASPNWEKLKVRKYGDRSQRTIASAIAATAARAAKNADRKKAKEAANAERVEAAARASVRAPAPVPVVAALASNPVTPEAPKQVYKRPQPPKSFISPPGQLYFSKRRPVTVQEREDALYAAQCYAAASYNRVHVMQLRASQVYCGRMLNATFDFAAAMELPIQGDKAVTLYDVTGRRWKALWHGEHPKRTGLDNAGWTTFVLDHFLEEGDACVFELPDPKVHNICVTLFPVVTLNPTPARWKDHYSVEGPVVPAVAPAVVPTVVQPQAADCGFDHATVLPGQCSSFEIEDSGMEGKRRRLRNDTSSGEENMNKSCDGGEPQEQ